MGTIDVSASAFPGIAGGANPGATHIRQSAPLMGPMDPRRATTPAEWVLSPPIDSAGESVHASDRTAGPLQSGQAAESVAAQASSLHAAEIAAAQSAIAPTSTAVHFAATTPFTAAAPVSGYGGAATSDSAAPPPGFAPSSGPALPQGSRSLTGEGAPQFDPFAPQNDSNYGGQYSQPVGGHPIGTFAV